MNRALSFQTLSTLLKVFMIVFFTAVSAQSRDEATETFVYVGADQTIFLRDELGRKVPIDITRGLEVSQAQLNQLAAVNPRLKNSFETTRVHYEKTAGFYGAKGTYYFKDSAGKQWKWRLRAGDRIPYKDAIAILSQNMDLTYFDFDFSVQKEKASAAVRRKLSALESKVLDQNEKARQLKARMEMAQAERLAAEARFNLAFEGVQAFLKSEVDVQEEELRRAKLKGPFRPAMSWADLQSDLVQNKLRAAMEIYPKSKLEISSQDLLRSWQSDPNMAATIIEWYDKEMEDRRTRYDLTPAGKALLERVGAVPAQVSCIGLFN